MNFFFAKKTFRCCHCPASIERGEPCVRLPIKQRQGGILGLLFHPECYPKWQEAVFVRRFLAWRNDQIPPKKRGRPRIPCRDRPLRRRLLSLLAYHKHRGNRDRVLEIEIEIKELEQ